MFLDAPFYNKNLAPQVMSVTNHMALLWSAALEGGTRGNKHVAPPEQRAYELLSNLRVLKRLKHVVHDVFSQL